MANPRKFLPGIDVNNQPIINVPAAVNPGDAVNLNTLQNAITGLAWKQPVRVATTAAGTLSTSFANGQTVDGVTLATGDRILVKNQATGSENGIYTVNASGAPTRATDADSASELNSATVFVTSGTASTSGGNRDTSWNQSTDLPITVGTTALVFGQVGGGTAYTAGNGLTLAGTTFSVAPKSGGGIVVDGTGVSIDPTYSGIAKRYAATLPAGGTSTVMTHNLGTLDVVTQLWDVSGSNPVQVEGDINATSVNAITVGTPTAVVSNTLRLVVLA